MTDGNDEVPRYRTTTVGTVRGFEARARAKMEKDGWEFVSQNTKLVRTEMTFRRQKSTRPWYIWAAAGAIILALVAVITIGAIREGNQKPESAVGPAVVASSPSAKPSETPSPTPTSESTAVTDAEVIAAFQGYFSQRAAAGVVLAKTVTSVTFTNRVVQVTFDPAAAGIDKSTFNFINPYANLASFAASPIAFNDDVGNRLRPAIDSIVTVEVDGSPLGAMSASDILALNGLTQ